MIDVINAGSGLNTASRDKFPASAPPAKDARGLRLEEMKSPGCP